MDTVKSIGTVGEKTHLPAAGKTGQTIPQNSIQKEQMEKQAKQEARKGEKDSKEDKEDRTRNGKK